MTASPAHKRPLDQFDIVVTDLDGTLWGDDERMHQRTERALSELLAHDVPVLVATGRQLSFAAATLWRHGLSLPAVVLDGALGHDLATARTFHVAEFAPEDAVVVLRAFERVGLEPLVYVDRPAAEIVAGPSPTTKQEHLEHVAEHLERDDLQRVVRQEQVLGFVVYGPREKLLAVAEGAAPAGATVLIDHGYHGGPALTVRPRHTSKWEGVVSFCKDRGLDPGRVLAVANGENDIELLEGATVSCVVSDGCDAALAKADRIIGPPDEGGWSEILDL